MDPDTNRDRFKTFISYYKPHKKIFAMDLFFAGLSAAAVLLFPLVSGWITREVLLGWDEQTQKKLFWGGGILLLLTVVKVLSNMIYAYFGHAMGAKMEKTMRDELFVHYQKQGFDFHAHTSVGKLMTVVSNDLTNMTELFHHGPEDLLMTGIKFVGAFVILAMIHWPLTLILYSLLPILCIAAYITDGKMARALAQNKEDLSRMNQQLEDSLAGIRTVQAFGNQKQQAAEFSRLNQIYTQSKCYFYKVEAYFYESMESYPQFLTMLAIFFGALFIGKGKLDVPVLVTFLLYAGTLAQPVNTMLNFMRLYAQGKAGFIRFMDMMELQPEIEDAPGAVPLPPGGGTIQFEGVSFCYPGTRDKVLENVSFTIPAGHSAAFAGASGIGKTTISLLVGRFYEVSAGRITIDGVDLRDLRLDSLRENLGLVQQEVYIFNDTIANNIRFGNLAASDEEVVQAARRANIHDYICSLPQGYDSYVGTRGILLSGGQRQRLSIARLFLKNPKILILDEATSALDYESEEAVQKSMEELMQGRTSIVIAHRLSTIQHADEIYVLGDKNIKEQGTHQALLAQGGEYARLCQLGQP